MNKDQFISEVFEIAFGEDAFHSEELSLKATPRAYSYNEVLEVLRQFNEDALRFTDPKMFND